MYSSSIAYCCRRISTLYTTTSFLFDVGNSPTTLQKLSKKIAARTSVAESSEVSESAPSLDLVSEGHAVTIALTELEYGAPLAT